MTREQAAAQLEPEIQLILKSICMPSTGNTEQDEAHLHHHAISTAMIAAGFCPNGCGKIGLINIETFAHGVVGQYRGCEKCGFSCR